MKNMISGTVDELTREELLQHFDRSAREKVRALWQPDAEAVVLYQVLDMSSSQLGRTSAMVVGPEEKGFSYTLAKALAGRLGDVPSRFAYPVAFAR